METKQEFIKRHFKFNLIVWGAFVVAPFIVEAVVSAKDDKVIFYLFWGVCFLVFAPLVTASSLDDYQYEYKIKPRLLNEGDNVEVIGESDFPEKDKIGKKGVVLDREMVCKDAGVLDDYVAPVYYYIYKVKVGEEIVEKAAWNLQKL